MKLSKLIKENKQPLNEDCAKLISPLENLLTHIEDLKPYLNRASLEAKSSKKLSSRDKKEIPDALERNYIKAQSSVESILGAIKWMAQQHGELK